MWILIMTLLLGASAKWSEVKDLYMIPNSSVAVQDLYVDQENGDHHILFGRPNEFSLHYWKMDKSFSLLSKSIFRKDGVVFNTAKFRKGVERNTLYIVFNGGRMLIYYCFKDQYFSESKNGGETWTTIQQSPRPDKYDMCLRNGLVMMSIDGHLLWFYEKKCPGENHKIFFSERQKGSTEFSEEKSIYESYDYEIANMTLHGEYTLENGVVVVHLLWFGRKDIDTPLFYMQSKDLGKTFTQPKRISPRIDTFAGFLSMTFTSNAQSAQMLVGLYAVSPFNNVRMFYSKDNGKTFEIVKATENQKVFHSWFYCAESVAIFGPTSSPKLASFSQIAKNSIEFDFWDVNSMIGEKNLDHPFKNVIRAYGVAQGSYCESNICYLTVMAPVELSDSNTHILVSQKTFTLS